VKLPRPIETLLSLPRVRLIDKVPILETQEYVRRFIERVEYHRKLVKQALRVSDASAVQFSADDEGLSVLLREVQSAQYVVTKRSKRIVEDLLNGICADGRIFKGFENNIQPLCEISPPLRDSSTIANSLTDKAKEDSFDLARALLIHLPTDQDARLPTPPHEV
jgi:hypothetical protein